MKDIRMDEECKRLYARLEPRMFDCVDKWVKEKPNEIALIEYDTGEQVTWKQFALNSKAMAAKLLAMGIKKGDVVATTLVLLKEHVFPLDPRLKTQEIDQCFEQAKPVAYFFLGKTPLIDFRPMVAEIMKKYKDVCKHWIQFQKEEDLIIDGAVGITKWAADIKKTFIIQGLILGKVKKVQKQVDKRDDRNRHCFVTKIF